MAGLLPLPRWILGIHATQIVFAVVVLGLDAYGIRWISYNALIFSLVAAIFTMGTCAYIIGATLFLQALYNAYVVLALHILMVIFWIADLGLVANLARLWADPDYTYDYYYSTYYYDYDYYKRSLAKRTETTTVEAYKGALIAGALFGAVEFVLWLLTLVFVIIYLNRARSGIATVAASGAPPAYTGGQQPVAVENKYTHHGQPQGQYQQPAQQPVQPQQPYTSVQSPQPTGQYGQQPGYGQQPQPGYGQPQQQPYA